MTEGQMKVPQHADNKANEIRGCAIYVIETFINTRINDKVDTLYNVNSEVYADSIAAQNTLRSIFTDAIESFAKMNAKITKASLNEKSAELEVISGNNYERRVSWSITKRIIQ